MNLMYSKKFYDNISRKNEIDFGDKTESRKSQINMYSGKAHFIIELIQNADDSGATEIKFHLTENELTIEHNGVPFNEADVWSITQFEESESAHDKKKTGRFGIGFKSVFQYTAHPIIHSGPFSFEIYDLYRARPVNNKMLTMSSGITIFRIPFDHFQEQITFLYKDDWKSPEDAYDEIFAKLNSLQPSTILFTRKLHTIVWRTDKTEVTIDKTIVAKVHSKNNLNVNDLKIGNVKLEKKSGKGAENTQYMVLSKKLPSDANVDKDWAIDFALPLTYEGKIFRTRSSFGKVFVTFEVDHAYTGMGFHINAPFVLPPTRENLSDKKSDRNQFLQDSISSQFKDVVKHLQSDKLINWAFLCNLLVEEDYIKEAMAQPLHKVLISIFQDIACIPCADGGYCTIKEACFLPSKLQNLFNQQQLQELLKTDFCPQIVESSFFADENQILKNFLRSNYTRINLYDDPEKLLKKIKREFLQKQETEWHCLFYSYLGEHQKFWHKNSSNPFLAHEKIVLMRDGSYSALYDKQMEPAIFLPGGSDARPEIEIEPQLLEDDGTASFFKLFGAGLFDDFEAVLDKISLYARDSETKPGFEEYAKDLMTWMDYFFQEDDKNKQKRLMAKLKEASCIRGHSGTVITWHKPDEALLPRAYLHDYYRNIPGAGPTFISMEIYDALQKSNLYNSEKIESFFTAVGVSILPGIYPLREKVRDDERPNGEYYDQRDFNPVAFYKYENFLNGEIGLNVSLALFEAICILYQKKGSTAFYKCQLNTSKKMIPSSFLKKLQVSNWIMIDGIMQKPAGANYKAFSAEYMNIAHRYNISDVDLIRLFECKMLVDGITNDEKKKLNLVADYSYEELSKLIEHIKHPDLVNSVSILGSTITRDEYYAANQPEQVSDKTITFRLNAIHEWWKSNRQKELRTHNMRLYGSDVVPQWNCNFNDLDDSSKKIWIKLLLRAVVCKIGRVKPNVNDHFIRLCENRKWFDAIVEKKSQDSIAFIVDNFIDYVENSLDENIKYFNWMQVLPSLFIFIRYSQQYYHIARAYRDEKISFQDFSSPNLSESLQGSITAPPLSGVLGIGLHFFIRELVRSSMMETQRNYRYCYVPSRGVIELLRRIGIRIDDGNRAGQSECIYEVLCKYLDKEKAHFFHSFDIPLAILSTKNDKMQDVLGDL